MTEENSVKNAVLVSIAERGADVPECERSLDELERLLDTAGGVAKARVLQIKDSYDPRTVIGKGKVAEIKELCENNDIDLVVFDLELSPMQIRNLEEDIGTADVIDRSMLILDIFALHAISGEGKLQVELAQLKYTAPRLVGKGLALSRQGGGIGTRGPGETKLETDRRHLHGKIAALEEKIRELEHNRSVLRAGRDKSGLKKIAVVGYTNAGKSTLLNKLTDAGVLAENKLFATLDPTSRGLTLPDGRQVMLVDTVGLIRRLPHKLVEAFKSTLEEAAEATVILNVCDASDEHSAEHLEVTRKLLNELGCEGKPVISVMNKCDLVGDIYSMPTFGKTVMISAKEQKGFDELLEAVLKELPPTRRMAELLIPFSMGAMAARIRNEGVVEEEEYRPEGLYMRAIVEISLLDTIKDYILE
jgi:GTP-binding protein HflX